jgi:sortase A
VVVRRTAAIVGRGLITVGVLVLLFVAYQLWGTRIYASQQQSRLRREFSTELRKAPPVTTPSTGSASSTTTTTEPAPPVSGGAVARIEIPKIGVDAIVVDGVDTDDLRKGPGHYPQTPLPGQLGNSAIAGHRTTYGAWFGNIDQLSSGDEILLRTLQGSFTYRVYEQQIVDPSDIAVLGPDSGRPATLTLTTCNPKYSASQRLVVKAALEDPAKALPAPRGLPNPSKLADETSLSGDSGSLIPALITGLIAAAVGGVWWLVFHRHGRLTTWIIGAIPFAVALFFFFSYLERLLPANY